MHILTCFGAHLKFRPSMIVENKLGLPKFFGFREVRLRLLKIFYSNIC